MDIHRLRRLASSEIIDYPFLINALQEYRFPRKRISLWLRDGALIRVKKGLYIFGPDVALTPYSTELLANLVYGPSYLSLEYALSFHGLIPERVSELTSVTCRRDKRFVTPVATFTYRYLRRERYPLGFEQQPIPGNGHFIIATPEKALADYLLLRFRAGEIDSVDRLKRVLFDDLRITEEELASLDRTQLAQISELFRSRAVSLFDRWLRRWAP